jgi:rfaE bifunctional protein nucleotidyltransferase chain/domain
MSFPKLAGLAELAAESERLRGSGKQLVLTNGCFDLLHVGHVRYLRAARELGATLVVAVNGDASVRKLKGPGRPLNSELERAEVLAALGFVDFVTVFQEVRVTGVIRAIRPQIYVKGGDYTPESLDPGERAALEDVGAVVRILQFVDGKSTTALVQKISAR